MATLNLLALILTLSLEVMGQPIKMAPLSPMPLAHEITMDQLGKYIVKWTPQDVDIIFEVHVATTGYIGFGFSTNGGMRGSDIIVGGVDDLTGEVYLTDRHATGNSVPEVDSSQDVQLLEGFQNETHTALRFSRPWYTCDSDGDLELNKEDTVRLIWAYGDSDPVERDPMTIKYHSQKGSKSLYLNEPRLRIPDLGEDVKTWELRSPNLRLPKDVATVYWCKLYKIPPLPRKTHVIGYVPIISEDNIQHVHHILLYGCHLPESDKYFEKWIGADGGQCFDPNMPVSWKYCSSLMVGWAVGGEGTFTPEHVGFPLGEEHGGATYFMMELHYENPNLRKGIVDNSGLRIYYTEKLREHDAGIMILGLNVSPMQIIPPGQHWLSIGHCSSDCTGQHLPGKGVNVFGALLHTHTLGRNMTLRHIRGHKELPVIMQDLNYDFNFQETRNLKEELVVLPGDSLIVECGLDSTSRSGPTFGGFGTYQEMCHSILYYYPRVDLTSCFSELSAKSLFDALGIKDASTQQGEKLESSHEYGIDLEAETILAEVIKQGNMKFKIE
ncbi:DBH-like monooxygenase protein 1, partial [Macrobrachium nipponense]|uniref:DBH-like monooxygenase protein 1 n=1 Tax=Macrobrachium nipponense TaxID=159736 RepID=UPI0030C7A3BC